MALTVQNIQRVKTPMLFTMNAVLIVMYFGCIASVHTDTRPGTLTLVALASASAVYQILADDFPVEGLAKYL